MDFIAQLYILLDLFIAAVLGGLVGFEREWKNKPAGLRTNMIIASSSAFFVSLGRIIIADYEEILGPESTAVDPIRMLYAVLVGISVIGAGTILKGPGGNIKYLTTAATILMASAIGISVSLKQYGLAVGATLLVLIVNRFFAYLDKVVGKRSKHWKNKNGEKGRKEAKSDKESK